MAIATEISSSTAPIALIVSIGNFEPRYLNTRHNAGHWLTDRIAEQYDFSLCSHGFAYRAKGSISDQEVWLAKSTVSMNLSGRAVAQIAQYYRIQPEKILVLHDELDFPSGTIRMKFSGSSAGHNGLKDITRHLHTDAYWRCRIGIDRSPYAHATVDYVLSPPTAEQKKAIEKAMDHFVEILGDFIGPQREKAIQTLHNINFNLNPQA